MTLSSRHLAATFAVSFSLLAASSAWAADKLAAADASMLKDIAQANMAEVETGKLALEKSPTPRSRSSPR
jgi:putative membrane protein